MRPQASQQLHPYTSFTVTSLLSFCFRLHDSSDYPWRPTVSHADFQKLLSNLTAIKIRGTYSERSTRAA